MNLLRTLGIVVVLFAVTGCGYTHSAGGVGGYEWKPLYRPDVRTIAVPIFTTKSFDRNVEFQLTKALVNTIEAKTPYKVVPRERADTILEGEITAVTRRNISSDNRSGVPQEQLYEVVVNFTWKDLRNGKLLVNRENFEQTVPFYPTLGESQFIGSQQNVERLAQGIVGEMQSDW